MSTNVPKQPNRELMAPIPERAYQGILDSKHGLTLGQYVQPSKRKHSLRNPIEVAASTRQMRKRGGTVVHELHGGKAAKRLDRGMTKKSVADMIHKHEHHEHEGQGETHFKKGGRLHRKDGGKTKGKTNINIVIGHPGGGAPMGGQNMQPSALPMSMARPAPPVPPQMGPPMQPPPGPMGGGMPPMGPPPIARKFGGRLGDYKMDAGSESGMGRLQKAKWYGSKTMGSRGK